MYVRTSKSEMGGAMVVYKRTKVYINTKPRDDDVTRNDLNHDDHSPKITTPTTARTAVKPTLTEVEKVPLPEVLEGTLDEVLVGVLDEVLDGTPDSEEDESGMSGVFVSLASCRKAA